MLIKISNFSKFAVYIADNVRPVQQNSIHSVGNINKIEKKNYFNTLCFPPFLPCYYLSFPKF